MIKIRVKAEGYRFSIPLPVGIMTNGIIVRAIERLLKDTDVSFTREQILVFLKEIRRAGKEFPNLKIIDVKTADGHKVSITL